MMSGDSTLTFLSISISYDSTINCRDYLDDLEDKVQDLASTYEDAHTSTSSASESVNEWTEVFALRVTSEEVVDSLVEDIISTVRKMGIPHGCNIELQKREATGSVERVSRKIIFPKRNTKWQDVNSLSVEEPESKSVGDELPERIRYLTELVRKYYQVGGKDVGRIFRGQSGPDEFMSKLSVAELNKLRTAYNRIIDNNDQKWAMKWFQEDCDGEVTTEKAQVIYFLAFLDQLKECGLANETERFDLVDWDSLT